MGERKFALQSIAQAAEQAVVATVESECAHDMRVSTPGPCSMFAGTTAVARRWGSYLSLLSF